jgi:TPR repeat protein
MAAATAIFPYIKMYNTFLVNNYTPREIEMSKKCLELITEMRIKNCNLERLPSDPGEMCTFYIELHASRKYENYCRTAYEQALNEPAQNDILFLLGCLNDESSSINILSLEIALHILELKKANPTNVEYERIKTALPIFECIEYNYASLGNADDKFNLAVCYENGNGVAVDLEKAIELYTLAANQGNADAQYNLALCYNNGEGVDMNLEKAIEFYILAANQGDACAQNSLGFCYENGQGVDVNLEKAIEFYTLAANQGDAYAQYNLACCYESGRGVDVNLEKAIELYTLAANQDDVDAQNSLKQILDLNINEEIWLT